MPAMWGEAFFDEIFFYIAVADAQRGGGGLLEGVEGVCSSAFAIPLYAVMIAATTCRP